MIALRSSPSTAPGRDHRHRLHGRRACRSRPRGGAPGQPGGRVHPGYRGGRRGGRLGADGPGRVGRGADRRAPTSTWCISAPRTPPTPSLPSRRWRQAKPSSARSRWPPRREAERLTIGSRAGAVAAVPFVYRFYPTVREARARVAAGEAGSLWLLHGSYLQDWLAGSGATNWRVDPALGGASRAFGDIGVHWCDLMEFVTGQRIIRRRGAAPRTPIRYATARPPPPRTGRWCSSRPTRARPGRSWSAK